ncbi:MAG: thioredoxin domain-containing protein [Acidobacteriota bacterium]|nr:thioredoxin domain-containing protein [Acidobacteriota bacterium]
MRRILLFAAIVLTMPQLALSQTQCTGCGGDTQNNSTVQELKKLDSQLDEAFIQGNKTLYEQVLDDGMIVVSDGRITRKADFLKQVNPAPAAAKRSLTATDVEVYLFGDTAIVTSLKTIKRELNNHPFSDDRYETNTYVRKGGRWQLIASERVRAGQPYTASDVDFNLAIENDPLRGNKKATVVLIEYSDYQCPFCRKFEAETMKQIDKDYISAGRVGFIFRDYPLELPHPYAFKAAMAARCAGVQGKYWEMQQRLFQEPMALRSDDLLSHAQSVGLNMTNFSQCLDDEKTAFSIRTGMNEAAGLGVGGTPAFFVGVRRAGDKNVRVLRVIQGARPYSVFKATLDTVINAQAH